MTPYTTALRLVTRQVEETSRALADMDARLAQLDAYAARIAHDLATEQATVAESYIIPVHAFHARRREDRERLAQERATVAEEVETIRMHLAQLQARQQGLEAAADQWRRDEQRRLDRREQAAADDRSATQIVAFAARKRTAARRRAAREGVH